MGFIYFTYESLELQNIHSGFHGLGSVEVLSENTHLLRKGWDSDPPDLLIDWFGFGQTSKSVDSFHKPKQLNPNQ